MCKNKYRKTKKCHERLKRLFFFLLRLSLFLSLSFLKLQKKKEKKMLRGGSFSIFVFCVFFVRFHEKKRGRK